MTKIKLASLVFVLPVALSGCGLYVPEKDIFSSDDVAIPGDPSPQGMVESDIVAKFGARYVMASGRPPSCPTSVG